MKKVKVLFLIAVIALFAVPSAHATIGWAGQVWPVHTWTVPPSGDVGVYVKVWKAGCTDPVGPCADVEPWLYYKRDSEAVYTAQLMTFNAGFYEGDTENEEWTGTIPAAALNGGEGEDFHIRVHDLSDDTWWETCDDQWGHVPDPDHTLNVQPGTSIDVTVTFRVDMNCVNPDWYAGGVYFTGQFFGWGSCNPAGTMSDADFDGIWEGSFVFPAGTNTVVPYKFQRNDGMICHWENGGDHFLNLDDSSPTQMEPVYVFRVDPWGPQEITAAGYYCVGLACCPTELWIRLNTIYNPPILSGVSITPGCINCDGNECLPGSGDVEWFVRDDPEGNFYLVMCIIDTDREVPVDGYAGCFCVTIDEILPVELNSFAAVGLENAIRVAWTTSSERNTSRFVLDRSTDQNNWSPVAELAAAGNSQSARHYEYVDHNVVVGTNYSYRLTVVDMDGATQVHQSVASATPNASGAVNEFALSQNYPNPFNPETSISYTLAEASKVTLKVFNIAGEEIATLVNGNENAGSHTIGFSAANLPSGLYFYRLDAGDFSATRKMMLLK